MYVRREQSEDRSAVRRVHRAAFAPTGAEGTPDRGDVAEAALVDALRADASWIDALSWVAVRDDVVVGHVVCSRGRLVTAATDQSVDAAALAPIGVLPAHQGSGIGSALMFAVIGAADALGLGLIALVGAHEYYARFGFVPGAALGIAPAQAAWASHFQVLPLSGFVAPAAETAASRAMRVFHYPAPFDAL